MKRLFFLGVFLYLGIGFYLYLAQRDFMYFPVRSTANNLKERTFENDGHKIKATVLNSGNQKAIIYFGGNAENVESNAEVFSDLFSEYSLYLVKYRGYGGSTGEPTEEGIYSDALYIYETIREAHNEVSIIGRSLGSAVATYVASQKDVSKLVLVTPFDSAQSIAQSQFPIYPISVLLRDKHDSYSRAGDIRAETLVIAAEKDRVIGMRHTKRLLEGFSFDVSFHVIKGVGHNNLSSNPRYYLVLRDFLSLR